MMTQRDAINNEYFEWMVDLVCSKRFSKSISFRKLLMHLHSTEFTYTIKRDRNRAIDGIDLRRHYALDHGDEGLSDYLDGPCSILEMMVALSIRCEETIMSDSSIGDRTAQWFWGMVTNLDLGSMTNDRYDRSYVDYVLDRFLNREYEPDGRGGLFTVRHHTRDMRNIEIWYQLCDYVNTIT